MAIRHTLDTIAGCYRNFTARTELRTYSAKGRHCIALNSELEELLRSTMRVHVV